MGIQNTMSKKRTKKDVEEINRQRLKLYRKGQRTGLTVQECKTYSKLLRIVSRYIKSISNQEQWQAYLWLSRHKPRNFKKING
jgi:hypothetical protein